MTRATAASTLIAVAAIAVVAASITNPLPGAVTPDPVENRTLPDDGEPIAGGGAPSQDRPVFTLPGIGVSVPVAFDLPPWLGAALVLALLGGMLVAVVRELQHRPERRTVDPVTPDEVTAESASAAVGAAAGRAADRLLADADAAVTNEVYRAWREMTAVLDVPNPAASTPREFATAAVDAGLDPEDVETLTTLFERVRYGAEPVTDADAETVATILRTIQAEYGPPADPEATDTESRTDDDEDTGSIPDPWEDR